MANQIPHELLTEKIHLTSTLVEVVGTTPANFRAWRNINGLFPETQGEKGWNRFSVADICAAKTVKILFDSGLSTQAAVDCANAMKPAFEQWLEQSEIPHGEKTAPFFATLAEVKGAWTIAFPKNLIEQAELLLDANGTGVVILISKIVTTVYKQLANLGGERMATSSEITQTFLGTWETVFGNDNGDDNA